MSLLLSAAVVAAFLVCAALAWPAMYVVWSRAVPESRELNLWRLARQRGLTKNELGGEPELSRAVYRCIACEEAARCDAALASGREHEIDEFCPNRGYLARIDERHRRS